LSNYSTLIILPTLTYIIYTYTTLFRSIRSYKENGYNIVIKSKGRPTREKREEQRTREAEARKRRTSSPEFKAYCRKCIHKKIGCLSSKEIKPTKTEIARAVTELRRELG